MQTPPPRPARAGRVLPSLATVALALGCGLGATSCKGTTQLTVQTYTSPMDQIAVNSHLISGDTEAVLVDGQFMRDDAQKAVDLVKASGRTLKMVFLTHAHPDHYVGLEVIQKAFPTVPIVTTPEVLDDFKKVAPGTFQGLKQMLGALIPDNLITPTALSGASITVDGQELRVIKMTGGEAAASASLYAPSLNAVFAGDHLYGGVHLFIADCQSAKWQDNLTALRSAGMTSPVQRYYPGHGAAAGPEILDANSQYLKDVEPILKAGTVVADTIAAIVKKYPTLAGAQGLLPLSVPRYFAACNPPTALELPGSKFYPESITASADGTLYVGSLLTGEVLKFAPGSTKPTTFLAAGMAKGVTGVMVEDSSNTLLLCAIDPTFMNPAGNNLRRYSLADGTLKATYAFPGANTCNDMTLDAQGNLYVADSVGKIFKLAKGAAALTQWSADPLLAPSMANGFGVDGITFDGTSNIYVNTFSDSRLLRIPIKADGTADKPVAITVTPKIESPDGMRQLDANTLVLVEGVGRLTQVKISGATATATTLQKDLNGPTGVIRTGGKYYVTEGQLSHIFDNTNPTLPFKIRIFPQ